MAGKKGKSGGARKNSGPAKGTKYNKGSVSDKVKDSILKAAAELAEEYGETIEKAMMRLCYTENVQSSVKASVFKNYLESMVVRETKTESKIEDKTTPKIYIPKMDEED